MENKSDTGYRKEAPVEMESEFWPRPLEKVETPRNEVISYDGKPYTTVRLTNTSNHPNILAVDRMFALSNGEVLCRRGNCEFILASRVCGVKHVLSV